MSRFLALCFLTVTSILLFLFSFSSHPWAAIGFAFLSMAFPVGLMALGAARSGRLGRIAVPLGLLLMLLESALLGMLALRGQVQEGFWLLGLPAAAAIQIYGIFVVPLAIVTLGYALTFDDFGVSKTEVERLRSMRTERKRLPEL